VETRQKLEPLWKGPFEIQEMKRPNAVIQGVGKRKKQEVHINRLKPYFSSLSGAKDASTQMDALRVVGAITGRQCERSDKKRDCILMRWGRCYSTRQNGISLRKVVFCGCVIKGVIIAGVIVKCCGTR
jgi:hypothetical protein